MNVLITSVGRRSYIIDYFRQALKGQGLVCATNSIETFALRQADIFSISPKIYDSNYIPFLLDFCKINDISFIVSLFDVDLPTLAKNRSLFEERGICLIVSDYEVTRICNDKWLTYKFLCDLGLPQKKSYIKLEEVLSDLKYEIISYPLIMKPRWGMGSIGVYTIHNSQELSVLYNRLKREIFDSYIKYESMKDKDYCILIQEYIQGQEYGVEILNDLAANYVATYSKLKISSRNGETDIAETIESEEMENIGRHISEHLKHIALLDVDCIRDSQGRFYILDMNCRFGGQYPFSHCAGVNVPLQIVNWVRGGNTDKNLVKIKAGVRSCKDITPVVMRNVYE